MRFLVTAKCFRCYGSASGGTFEEASLLIDHSVGLSRNIPCGDDYNAVQEITENGTLVETSFTTVEDKSANTTTDESKNSKKKSKFR